MESSSKPKKPEKIMKWMTEKRRHWLYRIAIATGTILVFYGVATTEEIAVWSGLLVAILGGTADAHVGEKGMDNETDTN